MATKYPDLTIAQLNDKLDVYQKTIENQDKQIQGLTTKLSFLEFEFNQRNIRLEIVEERLRLVQKDRDQLWNQIWRTK